MMFAETNLGWLYRSSLKHRYGQTPISMYCRWRGDEKERVRTGDGGEEKVTDKIRQRERERVSE